MKYKYELNGEKIHVLEDLRITNNARYNNLLEIYLENEYKPYAARQGRRRPGLRVALHEYLEHGPLEPDPDELDAL